MPGKTTGLLNQDLKIVTKILTILMNLDQVGFLPTREARDNVTKVLNLIRVASSTKTQCLLSTNGKDV